MGNSARGDQTYELRFTQSNGYSPTPQGPGGLLLGYSAQIPTWQISGKHILMVLGPSGNKDYYPLNRARVRIDLGPDFVFEDGSRTATADVSPDHPLRRYLSKVDNADCPAATEAWKRWHEHPTQTLPVSTPSTPSSHTVACPHLQEIRDGVREINRLASRLELDDSYYQAAVEDMLAAGYNSEYARLGFTGDASSIVHAFSSASQAQASKASVVSNTRDKAQYRQQLATAMYAYSQGQPYQVPAGGNGINDAVAGYLCSADPAKMDIASWDALYHAGYIAYPLHKNVKAQMQSNAILGPIVLAANLIDAAPLAVGIVKVAGRAIAVDAGEIGVLKALAKSELAFETPRTFTTIERRLTGKELNAELQDLFSNPPFLDTAPAYEATTNETTQLIRFFFKSETRNNKVGGWLVRRELLIDEEGNLLPAKVIQDRLGLQFPPTHVCDVTVPSKTKFFVGTAAPQAKWGVDGGAEQFYIKDTAALTYGKDTPLLK